MVSSKGKFLALAMALMLALTPVMADEHLDETDEDDPDVPEDTSDEEENEDNETEEKAEEQEEEDSEIDGTDNSTALSIDRSEAEEIARNSLSENNWTLEDSSTEEEDGYYKFEFVVKGEDAEAEVRVDGSSGEIFRHEEELEKETEDEEKNESEAEELERVEVQNLEQAKERIGELRKMVINLREEVAGLEAEDSESDSETEVEFERQNGETEAEAEKDSNGQETEAEMERERYENRTDTEAEFETEGPPEDRGSSQNARDSVNGTPGNEQAQEKRPGFVSNFLNRFFN